MTSCDVPPNYDNVLGKKVENSGNQSKVTESGEKCEKKTITYSKEDLLLLRSAAASLERPAALEEKYFNSNGLWDPTKWNASPLPGDGTTTGDVKVPLKGEKQLDELDDIVELMPQRRSFRLGCQVQPSTEPSKTETGLAALQNRKNLVSANNDGKRRLTGRAAGQRKVLERAHFKDNDYDAEKRNGKMTRKSTNQPFRGDDRRSRGQAEAIPEWVTGGPTSQSDTIELKGFDDSNSRKKSGKGIEKGGKEAEKPEQTKAEELNEPKALTLKEEAELLHAITSRGASPSVDGFDLNAFLTDGGDYLPSDLFNDGDTEVAMKSKFSQWFQLSQSSSGGSSRPGSAHDEQTWKETSGSPPVSTPYFMPIQPASTVTADQSHSLLDILQKGRSFKDQKPVPVKEIKGRMNSDEVEARVMGKQPKSTQDITDTRLKVKAASPQENSAFGKFVAAMKEAGQLPEKPAPVVVGLPEHLLPKPPRKTSPSFEKLKRALTTSPLPLPLPLTEPHALNSQDQNGSHKPIPSDQYHAHHSSQQPRVFDPQVVSSPFTNDMDSNRISNSSHMFAQQKSQATVTENKKSYVPTAFMPTSVIRKIHKDHHQQQKSEISKGTKETTSVEGTSHLSHPKHIGLEFSSVTSSSTPTNSLPVSSVNPGNVSQLFQKMSTAQKTPVSAETGHQKEGTQSMPPFALSDYLKGGTATPPPRSNSNDIFGQQYVNGDSHSQLFPRPAGQLPHDQHILHLLQQAKETQSAQVRHSNQPHAHNMQHLNRLTHTNQQTAPFRPSAQQQQFNNMTSLFPGNSYQHHHQAVKQHLGLNQPPFPGRSSDLRAQQQQQQQAIQQQQQQQHFMQQKLIQAAQAMQQQQQHHQQMERQLAIQRTLAAKNRPLFHSQLPNSRQQVPSSMLAQRMNMQQQQQHRPLPTPMLPQQSMPQARMPLHHDALFRSHVPAPAVGPSSNNFSMAKENPLSRFFGSEVLKVAGARNNAMSGAKAMTVEDLEALNN